MRSPFSLLLALLALSACAVVDITADVAATAVDVTTDVAGTAVDVAASPWSD